MLSFMLKQTTHSLKVYLSCACVCFSCIVKKKIMYWYTYYGWLRVVNMPCNKQYGACAFSGLSASSTNNIL